MKTYPMLSIKISDSLCVCVEEESSQSVKIGTDHIYVCHFKSK